MEICKLLDKLVDRTLLEFDCGLDKIDADECGKVIDMIKDLADAWKNALIAKAMENEGSDYKMSAEEYKRYDPEYWRDMDKKEGRMYYTSMRYDRNRVKDNMGDIAPTTNGDRMWEGTVRDSREGRSGISRKTYMQTKAVHGSNTADDKQAKMKDLEKYISDMTEDVTEMMADASNEEKAMLKSKLQLLWQKM